MRRFLTVFWLACVSMPSMYAQDVAGLMTSSYGGLYRVTYNPSVLGGSAYKWQFNVGTVHSTISNRYFLYFGRNSVLYPSLASRTTKELYGRSRTMGSVAGGDRIHLVSDLRLPSLMLSLGRKQGIALQYRARGFVQGEGIPEEVRRLYSGRLDTPKGAGGTGEWGDFRLKQHSFSELSFSYGILLLDLPGHKLRAGATLKQLSGGRTSFIEGSAERYTYRPAGSGSENELIIDELNYKAGYTNPVSASGPVGLMDSRKYGQGWGVDLGLTYEVGSYFYRNDPGDSRPGYVLRLAASVNDWGRLNYRTTSSGSTQGRREQWVLMQPEFETVADFGPEGLEVLLGGEHGGEVKGTGHLPAMTHLEADVQLFKSFFVNVERSAKLSRSKEEILDIWQPDQVTVTPRWEYEDADYAIPVSFIEGRKKIAVGLSARCGPVHAGVSNFLGLIGKSDTRATYGYLGISLYHFVTRDHRKKVKWKPSWD